MHDISALAEERQNIHQALNIQDHESDKIKVRQEALLKLGAGQFTEEEYWRELSNKLGVQVPNDYKELHRAILREKSDPYPEMFELVEKLKQNGYKVFVLSNSVPPHAEVIKARGLYEPFDQVLLSQDLGLNKPDKQIYIKAVEKLGINPEETIFIDDKAENLIPAQELGMTTILATSPTQVVKSVQELLDLH